jgi:Ferritin-like domain
MKIVTTPVEQQVEEINTGFNPSRRGFLKLAGGIAGAGVLFSACHPLGSPTNIYLGSGDTALLNFLYVLEQIEAAFYTQAVATPYYGMTHLELLAITDVRDQEIAHREWLKTLLGKSAITTISPDFSSVTFADRTSTLSSAATIEDLVISGINGAASRFSDTAYPVALAKMVSVEARHSAYFRDTLTPNSLSDSNVTDTNGLGQAQAPSVVLAAAGKFSHTLFDSSKLPS